MTNKVRLWNNSIIMNGIATLTQRGQVVIPQPIRGFLGIEPSDKLFFEVEGEKVIARRIPSVDEAFGLIKTKKTVSKKEYKEAIVEQVIKKFKKK